MSENSSRTAKNGKSSVDDVLGFEMSLITREAERKKRLKDDFWAEQQRLAKEYLERLG